MKQRFVRSSLFLLFGLLFFLPNSYAMHAPGGDDGGDGDGVGEDKIGWVLNRARGRSASLMGAVIEDDSPTVLSLTCGGGRSRAFVNAPLHGGGLRVHAADGAEKRDGLTEQQWEARLRDAQLYCSALHLAALRGSAFTLQDLLAEGADPNVRGAHGRTPLHAAVAWGLFFLGPEACGLATPRIASARRGGCVVARRERRERMLRRYAASAQNLRELEGPDGVDGRVRFAVGQPDEHAAAAAPVARPVAPRPVLRGRSRSMTVFDLLSTQFSREEWSRQSCARHIAELLVKAGARPHARDDYMQTPLQLAEQQHGPATGFVTGIHLLFGRDNGDLVTVASRTPSPISDGSELLRSASPPWPRCGARSDESGGDDAEGGDGGW